MGPAVTTRAPDDLLPVFDLDLVLVTGKGGVGKTLVAASLAHAATRVGLRPLLITLGPAAALEVVLGAPVRSRPAPTLGAIRAMTVDPRETVADTISGLLRSRRLSRAVIGAPGLRGLLAAAPGVEELALWDALERALAERDDAIPRHRPIIVDLDATGHAKMFLDLPGTLSGLADHGPLAPLVARARARLHAPGTGVCLVTRPAPLVVEETLDLYHDLVDRELLVAGLVVNLAPGAPPVPAALVPRLDELADLAQRRGDVEIERDVAVARAQLARHRDATAALGELKEQIQAPVVELPWLDDPTGLAALTRLGGLLTGGAR